MELQDKEKLEQTQPETSPSTEMSKSFVGAVGLFLLEAVKVIVLAGITIVLVRYFLFKPFYVKGQSMEPTFFSNEYLIIDELSYRFRAPERGEVIVFRAPVAEKDYYLKRVIGLPNERVKVADNKVVVYNEDHPEGSVVEENYLGEDTPGNISVTLGPDQYFVMGDNRDASFDSRRFGPISRDMIVGRTWLRGWPFPRAGFLQKPNYNL